ncbi:hypothetical protein BC936DRAFT_148964 [Jimgerdemannia flammicorona]|uniref:Uncharacterized protein n=1 Tax=Jimgerdemannia flammicorona TaxID=994334 RepID=A0A433D1X7_9FUNG|nr:hypothetical protein BC936DRAFT_148964 [Jimgerdemannia flammicorona]
MTFFSLITLLETTIGVLIILMIQALVMVLLSKFKFRVFRNSEVMLPASAPPSGLSELAPTCAIPLTLLIPSVPMPSAPPTPSASMPLVCRLLHVMRTGFLLLGLLFRS